MMMVMNKKFFLTAMNGKNEEQTINVKTIQHYWNKLTLFYLLF